MPLYSETYGKLYNWHAVNTGKLAPKGWHVPTDAEWTILTNYLGGENNAGDKLKEAGPLNWGTRNKATNETGFTALPGGRRNSLGYFDSYGYWWSATRVGSEAWNTRREAWSRRMEDQSSDVYRYYYLDNMKHGYSVRCVKD